jgi:hypothetical protein
MVPVDEEYFAANMEDFTPDSDSIGKWMGCANHKFQLVLKVLEEDEEFVDIRDSILRILRSIRRSTNALHDLRKLTDLSVVLPVSTR